MAHVSELRNDPPAVYFEDTARPAGPSRGGQFYCRFVKRCLDIVGVLLLAAFVVPAVAVLAVLIRRDGGSAFYCQKRLGRNGQVFTLWKLRSMVPDADARLAAYLDANPAARVEWERSQKLKNDPRITGVGRIIRKTSLDELPQLWNILIGDMSIVGPRPMLPDQKALYPGRAYFTLRPGLTGFWQISARNETSFAARAAFDTRYARKISFMTDIWVILRTIRVVLRGTGY